MRILDFIRKEISGWSRWELTWLIVACATIISLSLYWKDSLMGIISATSGVAAVVCMGKGKRITYIFGLINVTLYAIISYGSKFYGEVMLNALYFLPMQFYGFYLWTKNMDTATNEVIKKRMTARQLITTLSITALLSVCYGSFLAKLGGNLPYLDSFSTVTSVVAMIISVKRFAEQWLLWILINVVSIIMWANAFLIQGSDGIATLLMWCVYLLNSIIMYAKWMKEEDSKNTFQRDRKGNHIKE